jgi:hypothetical protein
MPIIGARDPWFEQVVRIGGWAHRLYRLESRAKDTGRQSGELPRAKEPDPRESVATRVFGR